jgi:hypothetical protein
MSTSFTRLATVAANTKRNPIAMGGKVTTLTTYLIGLKILPLMPVSGEIIERYKLSSPRLSFVTYIQGAPDIVQSDVLVVGSVEYKIVGVEPWPTDRNFLELVLEKVVGA